MRDLAGSERTVLYDVPRDGAPERLWPGSIYLRGSEAWEGFLAERRRLDDGALTILLSLRSLCDGERLLAVDWGSSYANSLLLVEPKTGGCDLTLPTDPLRLELEALAQQALDRSPALACPDRKSTHLARRLRETYGLWTYWSGRRNEWSVHHVTLASAAPEETLFGLMQRHFPVRFPQAAFDRALEGLFRSERELFSGTVSRARIPFRSKLGLPLLHDPRYVDRAIRRLVNEGSVAVYHLSEAGSIRYGGGRPIPGHMPEDEFEQLSL
jgi:hypothetical protein